MEKILQEVGSTNSTSPKDCWAQFEVEKAPENYILPPSTDPSSNLSQGLTNPLPLVDLNSLQHPSLRTRIVNEIGLACRHMGFFQVTNHGVPSQAVEAALESSSEFFNLPLQEKMLLCSDDVKEPVRYVTTPNQIKDQRLLLREYLKHYSHPLPNWVHLWPSNPSCYRENMGKYTESVQKLAVELMKAILESLELNPNNLKQDVQLGTQVVVVNCYPACPEPSLTSGIHPHTDFGCLTIVLQDSQGLEVMTKDGEWIQVPPIDGALVVQVGDHLEVLSNGRYKSVCHRATGNSEKRRLSVACIHSLGMEQEVSPATQLVDEHHPLAYNGTSVRDFLNFLSSNEVIKGKSYGETLKIS